jgi:hypothetical protein
VLFSYTLPLNKLLQSDGKISPSTLNHISDIVAQLKDFLIKSVGTFYGINDLVSSRDSLVVTEIQQPRNASRQTHREIVLAHSAEEYY